MSPEGILIVRATALPLLASDAVERGSTGAPTAFRIWKAGANPTDKGVHCFTARSAKLLLAEQATRGNLYSIDVDHLSLNDRSPPESRKAVGFHKLEARDGPSGPELWATNVEWTEAVRSGLESSPPEWRYFSPAYNVHTESGEIVSYLNTALTNNPATWGVTALASRGHGGRAASSTERVELERGAMRAARLPPKEHEELASRMGRDARPRGIHWDPDHPNDLVFPLMTRDEARAFRQSPPWGAVMFAPQIRLDVASFCWGTHVVGAR